VVDVEPTSVRDVTKGRIVVLGGYASSSVACFPRLLTLLWPRSRNGFVGSAVCKAAAAQGFAVTSLSRHVHLRRAAAFCSAALLV